MRAENQTNATIAQALGWRKVWELSDGRLIGFCPDTRPWPESGCFNCPKLVPDYCSLCDVVLQLP